MEHETISMLHRAIFEFDSPRIEVCEDILARSIKCLASNKEFFELPIENLLNIIQKSKCKDPNTLRSLVKSMNKYQKEKAPLILKAFNVNTSDLSLLECENIIGELDSCLICKLIHDIVMRDKILPKMKIDNEVISLREKNASLIQENKELKYKLDHQKTTDFVDKSKFDALYKENEELKAKIEKMEKTNDSQMVKNQIDAIRKENERLQSKFAEIADELKNRPAPIVPVAPTNFINNIHEAARKGDLSSVRYLIEKMGVDVELKGNHQKTPLFFAVEGKHIHVARYLIEGCHANIDAMSINNYTPLYEASRNGNLEMVQFLVDKGARITDKDLIDADITNTGTRALIKRYLFNHKGRRY